MTSNPVSTTEKITCEEEEEEEEEEESNYLWKLEWKRVGKTRQVT